MMKSWGARRLVSAVLLPGAAVVLSGVSEADVIFHVENFTYLHEEGIPLWNRLQTGDFNGDDLADFVMGSWVSATDGYLEVFLGNGDGTFQALDHVDTREIRAWAMGDFDDNGLDDVLLKDYDSMTHSDTAWCYLSIGNGQFADPISVPGFLRQVGPLPNHTDVCDYDLDGDLDISLAANDSVEVYLGTGDGEFSRSWGTNSSTGSMMYSVESGDIDNDEIQDLICIERQYFSVFPGLGDGTFGAVSTWGSFSGPSQYRCDACCGDFNEDGWNDVAVTASDGSWTLFIFLNQGDGTFTEDADYCYIDGWRFFDIFCDDLDLDGHLDLGTSIGFPDEATILRGNGDGSFDDTQPLWLEVFFGGLETAHGDFDGDGDPDIAVTRYAVTSEFTHGIYVIPNETIQNGVEGGEPVHGLLTLTPSCNPFTSSVTIACEGDALPGQLVVYDITGHLIRSLSDPEGAAFTWDGRNGSGIEVPAGTYLIQGSVDGQVSSIMVVRLYV